MDVTDATFETDVLARSEQVPVVVDLWAPWCGPCRTLGPIIEKVVGEFDGAVVLAKVNTDENPRVSATFRVQSIPAVYALRDRKVVDNFIGAYPESAVREFVSKLVPSPEEEARRAALASGDEAALQALLDTHPADEAVIVRLAEVVASAGRSEEALALLDKVADSVESRRVRALIRVGDSDAAADPSLRLDELLVRVKGDDEARQEFLDLLELIDAEDPRKLQYRRALTNALY